jgi:6-phosphogluconolactonase
MRTAFRNAVRCGLTSALFLMTAGLPLAAANGAQDYWMYVTSYTARGGRGIYAFRFHPASGKVEPAGLAAGRLWEANADASWDGIARMFSQIRAGWPSPKSIVRGVENPVFLAIHPNGRYLYSANELPVPNVSAFRIEPSTGKLTILNSVSSAGTLPTFLTVDKTGTNALIANYGSGTIAVLPIGPDGRLRAATCVIQHQDNVGTRGRVPHPHSINMSPDNRFAIVADMGLDRVYAYRFDSRAGMLAPNDPPFTETPAGAGARHLSFHPNGRFAWLIEESGSSILTLEWNAAKGLFQPLGAVRTIPDDFKEENATAEIHVHPNGKFLYGSNRGHDSIAVFSIDAASGALTPVEYVATRGSRPRSFAIDPSGRYLFVANVETQNVIEFGIDPMTGRLAMTGTILPVPYPNSVKFAPAQ